MKRTTGQWEQILCYMGVKLSTAERWAGVFADEIKDSTFSKGDADLMDFLPTILHESMMLERMEENLDYAADRLVAVFGAHRITPAQAQLFGFD